MYLVQKNLTRLKNNQCTGFLDPKELEEVKLINLNKKTKLEAEVTRGEKMLSNPGFVNKAPEAKINEEKAKLENYKQMLATVVERLNSMR